MIVFTCFTLNIELRGSANLMGPGSMKILTTSCMHGSHSLTSARRLLGFGGGNMSSEEISGILSNKI
jgi:hypothetical protein